MTQANEHRRPEEIAREIEQTRAEMDETLDALERRLSPGQLVDQVFDHLRTEGTAAWLGEVIRRNPLPVAFIGLGLAWLALAEQSRRLASAPRRHPPAGPGRGRAGLVPAVVPVAAVSREALVAWLRDAHAMEHQALAILATQAERLEDYPELRARVREHLEQTRRQAETVERCLKQLGTDTSTLKDTAGQLTGRAQQLAGLFASDEVVKSGIAAYAFERYEIACYRTLLAAAEAAGEPEVVRVCEELLHEEEAMAAWLDDHLPQVARQYLARDAGPGAPPAQSGPPDQPPKPTPPPGAPPKRPRGGL